MSSGVGAVGQAGVRDRDGQVEPGLVRGRRQELLVQRAVTNTYEPTPSRMAVVATRATSVSVRRARTPRSRCIGLSERPCSPRRGP